MNEILLIQLHKDQHEYARLIYNKFFFLFAITSCIDNNITLQNIIQNSIILFN